MWRLWEPLEATVRASSSATSKASVEPSKAKDRGGKQANSETKEKDDKTKVVNSTDVIVTQEEPEKTVFIGAEVVTNASAVDAVRNILSTVEVSMPSPIVAPRKSFTNFSEAETGGGKVVSKKHLNPDEVEAVPESMENETTESHDNHKAMEVGSPVLGSGFWVPPRRLNPPKKQSMLTRMIQLRIKLTLDQGQQLRSKL